MIKDVKARKIFDSRGDATIEVDIVTHGGFGKASAPSGASRGRWEAEPYPAGGVEQAVRKVLEAVAPEIIGLNSEEQEKVDRILHEVDGTDKFSNLGGNTACAISLAASQAAASSKGIPLFQHLSTALAYEIPHPLGNVVGGGKHAKGAKTDIQEFLVLPVQADSFLEAAEANVMVHREVGKLLESTGYLAGGKGDEGAWTSNLETEKIIELVSKSCEVVSGETGVDVRMGLDMAASTLWSEKDKVYNYERDRRRLDEGQQIDFVSKLVEKYKLAYVEDPFHEEAFEAFAELTKKSKGSLICGDDLFVTNLPRLKKGVGYGAANSIIIKPNQVGTLTDAHKAAKAAAEAGFVTVMSHRSGDVCEPYIAHLAIAFRCPILKTGVVGGERIAKINELIRIEEVLGERAELACIKL